MIPRLAISAVALLLTITWLALVPSSSEAREITGEDSTTPPPKVGIEDYLSKLDGSYGLVVFSLDHGDTISFNSDTTFPAASMYKLLVMYRVYQAIDRGDLSLSDEVTIDDSDVAQEESSELYPGDTITIGDALTNMIDVSSNAAGFALTRKVGGWGEIGAAASELGMNSTYLNGSIWFSTPDDMAHFFHLLADRSLVSESASEEMIGMLLQQTVNDRIPAGVPDGIGVAHKTGELDGVRDDGGIVSGPGGRYVIVMMSSGADPDEATQAEAEVSQMVYQRFGE